MILQTLANYHMFSLFLFACHTAVECKNTIMAELRFHCFQFSLNNDGQRLNKWVNNIIFVVDFLMVWYGILDLVRLIGICIAHVVEQLKKPHLRGQPLLWYSTTPDKVRVWLLLAMRPVNMGWSCKYSFLIFSEYFMLEMVEKILGKTRIFF